MKMHEIKPAEGARTSSKRLDRGIGSGIGKTSGKGHKGQNARSGGGVRPGFEGGQLPLIRKLPIRGFNNFNFKKVYSVVNVCNLDIFEENTVIDEEMLYINRVVGKMQPYGLKVLGKGDIKKPFTVRASKFSKTAVEKIEKAGGKVEVI